MWRGALLLGAVAGGLVAWYWKLIHRGWQDWRQGAARARGYRRLFWRHSWRGVLVTAFVAGVLLAIGAGLR